MMISSISHTSEPHYALFLEIIWLITIQHSGWNYKFWSWPYLVFRTNITSKFDIFKTNYISCVIHSVRTFGTLYWFWIFSQGYCTRSFSKSSSLLDMSLEFFPFYNWYFFFCYYTGQSSHHHKCRLFNKSPTSLSLCDRLCPWPQFFIPFLDYNYTTTHFAMWHCGVIRMSKVYFPNPLMLSLATDLLLPMKCGRKTN